MPLFPEDGNPTAPVHTQSVFHALTSGIWSKKEKKRRPDNMNEQDEKARGKTGKR
jgi:hypothetical protein